MPVFANTPDDCPHIDFDVIGYWRNPEAVELTPEMNFTQVRQCTQCGLFQNVVYNPPKPVTP